MEPSGCLDLLFADLFTNLAHAVVDIGAESLHGGSQLFGGGWLRGRNLMLLRILFFLGAILR